MTTERSDKAYTYWKESSDRFDYFIVGLTGALTAYIGQGLTPVIIGLNPNTIALISVLCLVLSMIFGLKRIEKYVLILKLQHQRLYNEESRGALLSASQGSAIFNQATGEVMQPAQALYEAEKRKILVDEIRIRIDKEADVHLLYYKFRNVFLLVGFMLLVASRIMPAYMTSIEKLIAG